MINLLSQHEKQELRLLYRSHLIIVSLWLFFFLLLLSIIMLVPSYIIFSGRNQQNETNSTKLAEVNKETDVALATIKTVESKATRLQGNANGKLSDTILHVASMRTSGIKIRKFEYSLGQNLFVYGVASDRDSLRVFVKKLEADPLFSKVDSPISNLIGGKDIKFSIVLTPTVNVKKS